jgi:N utilization substance protein B
MATSFQLRSLAFQVLFQLDASPDRDPVELASAIEHGLEDNDARRAGMMAKAAYDARSAADAATLELAPGWPAHRQPAIDRAILRLAHFEIMKGEAPGPAVIDDAVTLAKEFGTEKSGPFVNALLDKIYKAKVSSNSEVTPPADHS